MCIAADKASEQQNAGRAGTGGECARACAEHAGRRIVGHAHVAEGRSYCRDGLFPLPAHRKSFGSLEIEFEYFAHQIVDDLVRLGAIGMLLQHRLRLVESGANPAQASSACIRLR